MFTLQAAPHYLSWGWVQISIANLIVIATMVLIFIGAVVFRMPADHHRVRSEEPRHDDD
ncbi:MAG TPA: hypothetical protein VN108_07765 [Marmoricola sp.]|nr:hypothetical protein [Marmoricola sp.]